MENFNYFEVWPWHTVQEAQIKLWWVDLDRIAKHKTLLYHDPVMHDK